jgi:GH18 family chitinase
MVRNENARANFISRLVALLLKWELDGVDYNWEYPNSQEEW